MSAHKKFFLAVFFLMIALTPFGVFADATTDTILQLLQEIADLQAQLDQLTKQIGFYNSGTSTTTGTSTPPAPQNPFISQSAPGARGKFSLYDEVKTESTLNVRREPSLSGAVIQRVAAGTPGGILGGPVYRDGYIWWNVTYPNSLTGWSAENWLTRAELFGLAPGTVKIRAAVDGSPWSGSFVVAFSYPNEFSDSSLIATGNYPGLPPGEYTFTYKSGGPKGAVFRDVTPDSVQTLTASSTRTFMFNFVSQP
ncbi:MAG: hypothetical protein A3C11_00150 [Candidatus Sungbacteria bacterium RIFCSPHIGHO2_02_FULL_49_12]|uniref:SH3b domain-containing protein n=1 Tax=Candidatus Sungbacteria bacterium RIFCSPHIGHO2_02_FULL_49_12 TaxID=1802271 RepID=A0A1G2KQQ4_9BACT|nr:MAG: hypothetical protein A3C11_00150 [Candidatus Sungbacteria bacterium RIFCSPHIGHO2_02_FULL_49_12]